MPFPGLSVRWHTIPPLVGLNITFANDFSGPNPTGTLGAGFGRVYSVQFTTSSGTEGTCGATDVSAKAKLTQLGIYAVPPFVGLFVQTLRIHNGGEAIAGPLYVVLRGLPSSTTGLAVPPTPGTTITKCFSSGGDYLIPLTPLLPPLSGGKLNPGSFLYLSLEFASSLSPSLTNRSS